MTDFKKEMNPAWSRLSWREGLRSIPVSSSAGLVVDVSQAENKPAISAKPALGDPNPAIAQGAPIPLRVFVKQGIFWSLLITGIVFAGSFGVSLFASPLSELEALASSGASIAVIFVACSFVFYIGCLLFTLGADQRRQKELARAAQHPKPTSFWKASWGKAKSMLRMGPSFEGVVLSIMMSAGLSLSGATAMSSYHGISQWKAVARAELAMGAQTPMGETMRASVSRDVANKASITAPPGIWNANALSEAQAVQAMMIRDNALGLDPGLDFILQNGVVRPQDEQSVRAFLVSGNSYKLTQEQKSFVLSVLVRR